MNDYKDFVWRVKVDPTGKVTEQEKGFQVADWFTPMPQFDYDHGQNTPSHVRFRGLRLELETLVTDLEYEEV